jgi:tetratricopeptide (TPR) repeat protein
MEILIFLNKPFEVENRLVYAHKILKKHLYIALFIGMLDLITTPIQSQTPIQAPNSALVQGVNAPSTRAQNSRLYIDGLEALANESYEEALTLLLEAQKNDPIQSGISYALSEVYFGLNETNNALFYAQEALQAEPLNSWYRLQYANIRFTQGYYQEAVKEIELVLTNQPNHRDALLALVETHTQMGFLAEANTIIQERILTKHFTDQSSLHSYWDRRHWYLQLYRNYESLGDDEYAKITLIRWSEDYPYDQQVLELLNNDQPVIVKGTPDTESFETVETVEKIEPNETVEIVDSIDSESTFLPENFVVAKDAIVWLNKRYQQIQKPIQNSNDKLNQNSSSSLDLYGELLEQALKLNDTFPEQGEILSLLAELHYLLGNTLQAKNFFGEAVKSPGTREEKSEWFRKLGELQAGDKESESALRSLSLSTRYNSNNALAWAIYAIVLAQSDPADPKGNDAIVKAVELEPDNPEILEKRGDYNEAIGDYDEAIIWWKKALDLGERKSILQQKISQYD